MRSRPRHAHLLIGLATWLVATGSAEAATFEVTERGDQDPDGCTPRDCTLREAVIAANQTAATDEIRLPIRRPYTLAIPAVSGSDPEHGDLDVLEPVRLVHPGKGRATIDAQGVGRVIEVYEKGAATTLSKLTLRGGVTPDSQAGGGGGVLAYSDLTLSRSRVVANESIASAILYSPGGGISMQQDADLTLRRSVVSGNSTPDDGGGISSSDGKITVIRARVVGNRADGFGGGVFSGEGTGSITIAQSTIAQNIGADGGGLDVLASKPTKITQSTISGNEALPTLNSPPSSSGAGGGIAISAEAGPVTIVNATIADNEALLSGGGIHVDEQATVVMNAVTIARNRADSADTMGHTGGGIYAATATPTVTVRNSLLALNRQGGEVVNECAGADVDSIASPGGNLITTESEGVCPYFDGASDIVDSEPRIALLAGNGGPTETIALRRGSPAINNAAGTAPRRDQRGVIRRRPDIGAYERR